MKFREFFSAGRIFDSFSVLSPYYGLFIWFQYFAMLSCFVLFYHVVAGCHVIVRRVVLIRFPVFSTTIPQRNPNAIRWDRKQRSLVEMARDSQRYLVGPRRSLTKMADKRQKTRKKIFGFRMLVDWIGAGYGGLDGKMYPWTPQLGLAGAWRIRGGVLS